jgi:hypothetical protein
MRRGARGRATLVNFARPLLALSLAVTVLVPSAFATRPWMSEEAMRAAFIGKTLDGHYLDGIAWSETYFPEGRLDYRESVRKGPGHWYFRGNVFCTFYQPGYGLTGGCWTTIQVSANCYEFYLAGLRDQKGEEESTPGPLAGWLARGWRKGEASTCEDRPSV